MTIKFGTDGWRAIIADDYTVDNVKRVAEGAARWMTQHNMKQVVIGHDTRFGGKLFAETTARVMGAYGVEVILGMGFVSTPMVSLGVVKTKSQLGIVITASHNPPTYNGFKLKADYGGASLPSQIAAVEALIPDACTIALPSLSELEEKSLLRYADLEDMYFEHVKASFDLPLIYKAGFKVAYDAMYGAGQRVMLRILPDVVALHCDNNPGFHGQAPEPIHRNLLELSQLIKRRKAIQLGIANDGDADRIGMYDATGKFVDSHHILLLLLLYLHKYKGYKGKVVVSFSVTDKMRIMAEKFGLPFEVTKIGFKHIAEIMTREDVIVGGEESGGLAVKGHIPERDGIWVGLIILEFMARTGKTLPELVREVYDIVGPFWFDRDDLHLTEAKKQQIIASCQQRKYKKFGKLTIQRMDDLDGFKFYFNDDEWVLLRASGTEPVMRVYAQAPTPKRVREILNIVQKAIL